MLKAYKIELYLNKTQLKIINTTIGCCRFLYNQILNEKIEVYEKLKNDKEALYKHKYKTEKEYKVLFPFLKEASSRALQQARGDLDQAFQNFYKGLKKNKKVGFPKFKSKKICKNSYREPQIENLKQKAIDIKDNRIKLNKIGWVKFRGLSKDFQGKIRSVTITKQKDGKYVASILVERDRVVKFRKSNNAIGLDLGLKEFITTSDGVFINGIKDKLLSIENEIKKLQKHFARKQKDSKRREKTRIKIAKLFQYKSNIQNHFFWHLANRLCSENQVIGIEDLNVSGMIKNRRLAHSISYSGWSKFVIMLKQKANEYGTEIVEIDRFFPSSKLCSTCGQVKEKLTLSERTYNCECGSEIDRDVNAAINIRNFAVSKISGELPDYRHRETLRPKKLTFNFQGGFDEVFIDLLEKIA